MSSTGAGGVGGAASSLDAALSVHSLQRVMAKRRIAEMRTQEKIRRAQRREGKQTDEEEEEEDEDDADDVESEGESGVGVDVGSSVRRRRVGGVRLTTFVHEERRHEVNPLQLLRNAQTAAPAPSIANGAVVLPSDAWSAELTLAAQQVSLPQPHAESDSAFDEVEWQTDEPTNDTTGATPMVSHSAPLASTTVASDSFDAGNDEVLFGHDDLDDEPLDHTDTFEEDQTEPQPNDCAMVEEPPSHSIELNKVILATPKSSMDATAAAASSLAVQEGALTISFDRIDSEDIAAQIKATKAQTKAQKQDAKAKKDAEQQSAKARKRKSDTGGDGGSTAKKRRQSGVTDVGDDDAVGESKKNLVPAQRLTKAARELLTHIQHVHVSSLFYLIQAQSSPKPGIGIMDDRLLQAKLMSIVINRCSGIQLREYVIDPRKASTWVGPKTKGKQSSAKAKIDFTWKSNGDSPPVPMVPAGASSSSSSSFSVVPPAPQGTIFDRVQKIAYWFRSYFTCHPDRLALAIADRQHPLRSHDPTLHVRLLHDLRSTCVRRRILHAGVQGRGLTDPWRHYHSCLRRQFEHILETREGGFQHLTMIFAMIMRQIGVLTRLCYGITSFNYKHNMTFPKSNEESTMQSMSDAIAEGLEHIPAGDGDHDAHALLAKLVASEVARKQDPRVVEVLRSAMNEPCQCQKPFQPTTFGTPSKQAALARESEEAAAAEVSRRKAAPQSPPHTLRAPAPAAPAAAPSVGSKAPRKAASFMSTEAIDLLSSDDDGIEVVVKSRHFAQSNNAAPKVTKPKADDAGQPKGARSRAVKRKLEVDTTNTKRTRSKPAAAAAAVKSDASLPSQRSTRNKQVKYAEDSGSSTNSDPDDDASGSCTKYGATAPPDVDTPWTCESCKDEPQQPKAKKTKAATSKPKHVKEEESDGEADADVPDAKLHSKSKKSVPSRKPRTAKGKADEGDSTPRSKQSAKVASAATASPGGGSLFSDDDADDDVGRPASSTHTVGAAASSSKLPKKKYFEHGYPLIWCEFYCPEEKRWIHVDVMRQLFDSEHVYEHDGGITFQCVIAVRPSVDGGRHLLTDVTKRYTRKWSNVASVRLDDGWMSHHLQRVSGECHPLDREIENADHASLEHRHATDSDMPTRLNEFKNHPLYCIEKFNKKFEMIYPSGPEHSKGVFIEKKKSKGDGDGDVDVDSHPADIVHLVYPRSSLHLLHTLDRWRREQRAVKHEEVPYPVKIVKKLSQMSRAQREDKIRRGLIDPTGEKSELYGIWQTEPWLPDAAQNGIVPKNERGHVDVWGASHIPPGCVHLSHPRLKATCKKLGIDFADAMTGFDVKGGRSVPRFEGVVICQEFEETVMAAYREMEKAANERAEKRRMKAITGNWRRLVRGSIIHARVMREVMGKAQDNQLAFVPAAAAAAAAAAAPTSDSKPFSASILSSTPYGALATSLHASLSASVSAGHSHQVIDGAAATHVHVHAFTQQNFDLATNAWTHTCACGAAQTFDDI